MTNPFGAAPSVAVPTFQTLQPKDVKTASFGIIYGPSGVGKTSALAHIPGVAFILPSMELGYHTLLKRGLVPSVPHAQVESWEQLRALTLSFMDGCEHKALVFDSLTPIERMCHEYVCQKEYRGQWGEKGFTAFQRGYVVAASEWKLWLQDLDNLRVRKGIPVILIGHSAVTNFKNPLGNDYDRMTVGLHEKTWTATIPVLDYVLLYTHIQVVDDRTGRAKGVGGQERVIYTTHHDSYDAKNRLGMPESVPIPNDPAQVWPAIIHAMKGGK